MTEVGDGMPIDIQVACRNLNPEQTTLLFGAGSSIPSGAPSGNQLKLFLMQEFDLGDDHTLTLAEVAMVIENKVGRNELVNAVRGKIQRLSPTGGLLNLPRFKWRNIYTTNYDDLVEKTYARRKSPLVVYSSNFDFGKRDVLGATELFKLHGTIEKDVCDGNNSRLIISESDYDQTNEYRDQLYSRFQAEIGDGVLLIIGQTLADPDLRDVVNEAIRRRRESGGQCRVILFLYQRDENRALIYESRGIEVCFGGLDEFFAEMAKNDAETQFVLSVNTDPLDSSPEIRPSMIEVDHSCANEQSQLLQMYNGRPANYADVRQGYTFERDISLQIESQLVTEDRRIAFVLGSAGVGKTTMARQTLSKIQDRGIACWEHKVDFDLPVEAWTKLDVELRKRKETGVLFIDDAHEHLHEINQLVEEITSHQEPALKLLIISTKPHWNPRLKTPGMYSHGQQYLLASLSENEINRLLNLLEDRNEIQKLVGEKFLGFSRPERRRRLVERCGKDMFVCLKNIFGFDAINMIILREFASLPNDYQSIYRSIAAMESAGVRVHRQLVLRVTGLQADQVSRTIDDLDGIIEEYAINPKQGVYGWRVRHSIIADLIAEHKFAAQEEIFGLLSKVIQNINPSYPIEVKSIRDICNMTTGIGRVYDKSQQNILLRQMISLAPAERVPRHRLITNLIDQEEFEIAENEIRIFEKELRLDSPVHRYKVKLMLATARATEGIMDTDRASLTQQAASLAQSGTTKFPDDKNMYRVYLEAGAQFFKFSKEMIIFDEAMASARTAQDKILDPELGRIISSYERLHDRMIGKLKQSFLNCLLAALSL